MEKLQLFRLPQARLFKQAGGCYSAHLQLTSPHKTSQRYRFDLHRSAAGKKKGSREFFSVDLPIEPVRTFHYSHRCQALRKHLVGDVTLPHLLHQQLMGNGLPLLLNLRLRLHPSPAPLRLTSIGILVIINHSIGRIRLVCSLYPISHLYDSVSNYRKH
jgi:hypothetical protein